MDLELTKEHLMLGQSIRQFIKKEHSFDRLRELKNESPGFSKKIWKKMIKLGWMGLIYPEEYDGHGLDISYAMVLLKEFGKALIPEPWLSTVLLGGNIIYLGGSPSQKKLILPKVTSGKILMTLGYLEDGGRYDAEYCTTSAVKKDKNFEISGKKIFVFDGSSADLFIVSARTSGETTEKQGITLFLIPRDVAGVTITEIKTIDGRRSCMLDLSNVKVAETDIVGEINHGYQLLAAGLSQATVGICAEMMGGMEAALDMTVKYISGRKQFGKPIGSFQAVQHKAAEMLIQKELATSTVYYAVACILEDTDDRELAVSTAKAKCSAAYLDITKTAIQLFGAYGFTNEADIGFFLKHAKASEILFGDADFHYDHCDVILDD